ncbi:MAG: AAA family ATPase [Bacteroidetes bacterium]|nr:AAA family ATPase [Bacteroidota bacterium]
MFLKEIYLKNYKCFEEATFSFKERFTVLIGENGSGKTAVLDGIARGLKAIVDGLNPTSSKIFDMALEENEIRVVSHQLGSKSSFEKQFPYSIKTTITRDKDLSWFISNSSGNGEEVEDYTTNLRTKIQSGGKETLPLIVYYRALRYWLPVKVTDLMPLGSRLDTFRDCLKPEKNSEQLLDWFKRMAIIQFHKTKSLPELESVRKAILIALESLRKNEKAPVEAYYSPESDDLLIDIGDGKEFPFRLLSDGYRSTLGLIANIAWRMAELNPHVTTDTPGVVLIDEIDLHLHPKWQRTIVGDLKRIFPNCQFIVTTHSPFIIQSLSNEDGIIRLDNEYEEVPEDFDNKSIEDIVEEWQGVENPQWSKKRVEMYEAAKKYYETLEKMNGSKNEKELQRLKEELDILTKPFTSNVAYVAFLEQKRLVKEAQFNKDVMVVNEPQAEYKKKRKS